MAFRELNSEVGELLILDLLSESERSKHQISDGLRAFLKKQGVGSRRTYCDTKEEVFEALSLAAQRSKENCGAIYVLAHGNEKAIGNKVGMEPITWEELRGPLEKINKACEGTLVLNLMACFGIEGTKITDAYGDKEPYYAIIGPKRKIAHVEAYSLTQNFYQHIIDGFAIPIAVKKINESFGEELIWVYTAQGLKA